MKNKKTLIMLGISITICAVASLSVIAAVTSQNSTPISYITTNETVLKDISKETGTSELENIVSAKLVSTEEQLVKDELFINESAAAEKTYVINNKPIPLKYSESKIRPSGIKQDIYLDAGKNEYTFASDGNIASYAISDETFINSIREYTGDYKDTGKGKVSTLTEEIAIEIAEKTARETFGDKFDLVKFDSSLYDDNDGSYFVYFTQKLGDSGFIEGLYCDVSILPDGTVNYCSMGNYDELINFDTALLDGITKDGVYADLEEKTREMYGDKLVDFEISDNIRLFNENGTYYFSVCVSSDVNFDNGLGIDQVYYDGGQVYRYDLTAK